MGRHAGSISPPQARHSRGEFGRATWCVSGEGVSIHRPQAVPEFVLIGVHLGGEVVEEGRAGEEAVLVAVDLESATTVAHWAGAWATAFTNISSRPSAYETRKLPVTRCANISTTCVASCSATTYDYRQELEARC